MKVPFNHQARAAVVAAVAQARQWQQSVQRPPVTDNERLCQNCSLAPVCLPEETRFAANPAHPPQRFFPLDDDRQILHVLEPGSRVGCAGEQLKITQRDRTSETVSARQIGQIVLHSFSQISTQALHLCQAQEIGIHWVSGSGRYVGSLDSRRGSIQRRRQQYAVLSDEARCLALAQRLVACRGRGQRQFLMRGKRNFPAVSSQRQQLEHRIQQMKRLLAKVESAANLATLLGLEGNLAALYFAGLAPLVTAQSPLLAFAGRNRRPPKDRFNTLLSFGYALLLKDVTNAILTVGLEPVLGFYHQPRSQAPPLALDLMEIFRVPLVDMPVLASVNRGQWNVEGDFEVRGDRVWLNDRGRRQFIEIYERRKAESWKHNALGYSLTYRRLLELEVRLLEKEWMGEGSLFARLVVR